MFYMQLSVSYLLFLLYSLCFISETHYLSCIYVQLSHSFQYCLSILVVYIAYYLSATFSCLCAYKPLRGVGG